MRCRSAPRSSPASTASTRSATTPTPPSTRSSGASSRCSRTAGSTPGDCAARVRTEGIVCETPGLAVTPWTQSAPIRVQGETAGTVEVFYGKAFPAADDGPFLKEERKLLETVAERLGQLLLQRHLLDSLQALPGPPSLPLPRPRGDWRIIVDFLRKTDPHLLVRVSRRMINHLCWNGVAAAQDLLPKFAGARPGEERHRRRAGGSARTRAEHDGRVHVMAARVRDSGDLRPVRHGRLVVHRQCVDIGTERDRGPGSLSTAVRPAGRR